jgi:LCP family protein required for cell wall assembly
MRRRSTIKVLFVALGVLVIGVGVLIVLAVNQYNSIKKDPMKVLQQEDQAVSEVQSSPSPSESASAQPNMSAVLPSSNNLKHITVDNIEYVEKPNVLSMLFCGGDFMKSREGRVEGERSDMIMVCVINAGENKATLISIPRDTRALVTKVDPNTGKVTDKEYNKINAAFSFGGGTDHYSYENTMRCVENFLNMDGKFGMKIRYYVGLNIDGIPRIADAIGGVTVKLEEDFPEIGKKGETVTLTGKKATAFVRERDAFPSQDLARTKHQQTFMIALAKKVQKMGAAQSIVKLYGEVTKYVHTKLNTDEMVALATLLDQMDVDKIEHVTIPGEWKQPYIWPDESGLKDLVLKTYYNPAE